MTLRLISSTVGWDKVLGATGYDVKRNGKTVTQTRTALTAKGLTLSSGDRVEVVARPYGQVQATVVTWAEPAGPPPPQTGSGIGLDQLGGSLAGCSHLTDRTYEAVTGSWDELDLLAQTTAAGTLGFGYQDGPAWVNDPNGLVALVKAAHAQHGFAGVFFDEVDANTPGMLAFIRNVCPALKVAGIETIANASASPSNDGQLWIDWAKQLAGYPTRIMLEYAQQFGHPPDETELRTTASGWAGWQRCVAAVRPSAAAWLSYGTDQRLIYCRASMLTAPGFQAGDIFMGHRWPDHADPYSPAWCKSNPQPTVNAVAGTATL